MAHQLKMATVQQILSLHADGWSQRRIARELGISRDAVARYVHLAQAASAPAQLGGASDGGEPVGALLQPAGAPKPATAPTGSGSDSLPPAVADFLSKAAAHAPRSVCEPYHDVIQAKLNQGLTAQRIYQDLVSEHGFASRYWSVRRYVRRLSGGTELPVRRMEVPPGEEAQVDFGTGAPVIGTDGKRHKTHVFRVVLSHSRKGYSEVTYRQTTDDFLLALENAFRHFGGVPKTLVIDNLKAAVLHPDWFDPELTPKVQAFCQHYGTVILPTRPRKPEHKGKIEAGVKYVQSNGLAGHRFSSLEAQNQHLLAWEQSVADTRIHGTTKQQVGKLFRDAERGALKALPQERFANFQEEKRKVNRDGHVEVAKAYYSVPPEYLGREVWARWDARLVRIFNSRWEQIAVHVRHEQGRFSTHGQHVAKEKISGLERGASYLLNKVSGIGEKTHQWAEAMLTARGIEGTRVLQGLIALAKKHTGQTLENACEIALSHGCFRLRTVRQLLRREAAKQQPLPFLDEHPLIRPLDDYAAIVARAIHRQADRSSVSEGFLRHDQTKACLVSAQTKSLTATSPPGPLQTNTADLLPPGSGYPSPGCRGTRPSGSAEPGSVSPDNFTVVPPSAFTKEKSDE
jgi:transposase